MIHFDEIKDKVILYLKTLKNDGGETDTFYVIRDVYGKISIYIIGKMEQESLKSNLGEIVIIGPASL